MESLSPHLASSPRNPHSLPASPGSYQRMHHMPQSSPTHHRQTFSTPGSPVMALGARSHTLQNMPPQSGQSPKLLHSLLYGYSQSSASGSAAARTMSPPSRELERIPTPVKDEGVYPSVPAVVARRRSGSIGSVGSSVRDSRSPSYDSASSHDSLSRSSPISVGSSPSPSPPASSESKLFGILKGTINTPYASLFQRPPQPASDHTTSAGSSSKRAHSQMVQDEPIDLSCKAKRPRGGSVSSDYGYHSGSPASSSTGSHATNITSDPSRSILESILSRGRQAEATPNPIPTPTPSAVSGSMLGTMLGGTGYVNNSFSGRSSYNPSPCSSTHSNSGSRTPDSIASPPQSPATSERTLASPRPHRCSGSQRVTLAKKMLFPINSRVSNWLIELVQFAKTLPEFAGLPHGDQLALLINAWSRLMLLFMAETNFQFAVTPVREEGPAPTDLKSMASFDAETPTMQGVEGIQCFIRKCQSINLDTKEYHLVRMVTLFHTGHSEIENTDFVDKVSNYVRQSLQDHIKETHTSEKLRYSNILLCLHTLYGVNCKMVQSLFCKQQVKSSDMDDFLKGMLQNTDNSDC